MSRQCLSVLILVGFLILSSAASGAEVLPTKVEALSAERVAGVSALTMLIDDRLSASWSAAGVQPAAVADDAEYLRRVYLDLAGRIPAVAEVRAFLNDSTAGKRERVVEQL